MLRLLPAARSTSTARVRRDRRLQLDAAGGGNLIGQAGSNLIGQAGSNAIVVGRLIGQAGST